MGLAHSPRVVTDGLVFAMDGSNPNKSWKGKPTTNLTSNTPSQAGWQGTYSLVDSNTKTFNITTQRNDVSGGTSAWRSFYWDVSSYVGSTVTISADVQLISETNCTFSSITIGQGNTGQFTTHIAGSDPADRVTVTTKPVQKIHMTWSGVINATGIVGFTQWIINGTANGCNGVIQISNVQIEVNDFATPFVNGTRSNTQAFLDLTGQNTVTVQSMTYNSDGTFEFDGSTDNFIIPTIDFSTAQTVEIWMKPTESDGSRRNPYNQAYGGFGTWTHETDGSINAYFGTSGGNGQPYVNRNSGTDGKVLENETACMCFTRDTSTTAWYKNGIQVATSSNPYGTLPATSANITIGDGYATAFKGSIFAVKLYNRALTAEEVAQNFNALRGRYGI